MQTFTLEELVQFLYRETSKEKQVQISSALENNWPLHEKYKVLATAKLFLDKLSFSPRKKAIDHIMQYAASATRTYTETRH